MSFGHCSSSGDAAVVVDVVLGRHEVRVFCAVVVVVLSLAELRSETRADWRHELQMLLTLSWQTLINGGHQASVACYSLPGVESEKEKWKEFA